MKKIALLTAVLMTAQANASVSPNLNAAFQAAARERCESLPFSVVSQDQGYGGSLIVQVSCGNIFNVRSVICTTILSNDGSTYYSCD
ncbi:hypothetical protein FJM67_12635 [Maribrevibacterium harenarium]|uniref:Uncharacterized protein n=1 Tax=Maribrevibacterium harenarium TaxID=2589817 RepID=A0A501WGL6_9GAMM|nr:hypothetical protein [Maribrevibacterium harenarium]TPE49033.1 hypothetical protein FJM67_12635 [Maribrevibacterium harenarium]